MCIYIIVATLGFVVHDLPRIHSCSVGYPLPGAFCTSHTWLCGRNVDDEKMECYFYAFLVAQADILGYALFRVLQPFRLKRPRCISRGFVLLYLRQELQTGRTWHCTEWRPRRLVWRLGRFWRAAIGELNVGSKTRELLPAARSDCWI